MTPRLARLEKLLMRWPCSINLQRQIRAERDRIAREHESRARALRGTIRRRLMAADLTTLAELAHTLDQEGVS